MFLVINCQITIPLLKQWIGTLLGFIAGSLGVFLRALIRRVVKSLARPCPPSIPRIQGCPAHLPSASGQHTHQCLAPVCPRLSQQLNKFERDNQRQYISLWNSPNLVFLWNHSHSLFKVLVWLGAPKNWVFPWMRFSSTIAHISTNTHQWIDEAKKKFLDTN